MYIVKKQVFQIRNRTIMWKHFFQISESFSVGIQQYIFCINMTADGGRVFQHQKHPRVFDTGLSW